MLHHLLLALFVLGSWADSTGNTAGFQGQQQATGGWTAGTLNLTREFFITISVVNQSAPIAAKYNGWQGG